MQVSAADDITDGISDQAGVADADVARPVAGDLVEAGSGSCGQLAVHLDPLDASGMAGEGAEGQVTELRCRCARSAPL